ncbi:MAG: hypothetical protein ABSF69_29815, partial [Polyangiaceae bacterium]
IGHERAQERSDADGFHRLIALCGGQDTPNSLGVSRLVEWVVKQDAGILAAIYGPAADAHAILAGAVAAPAEARRFLQRITFAFPEAPATAPVALNAL